MNLVSSLLLILGCLVMVNGDQKTDCGDGLEKNYSICNYTNSDTKLPNVPEAYRSCILTELPKNGYVYMSDQKIKLKHNDTISNFARIKYKCIENYIIVGSSYNLCYNGTWSSSTPFCQAYCDPRKISTLTIGASCSLLFHGQLRPVRCDAPAVSGTAAHIQCKIGYERPGTAQDIDAVSHCGDDGRWNPPPFSCSPICGQKAPEVDKVPWHVSIYRDPEEDSHHKQWCTGSILNSKTIISAMHCFWDQSEDKPYPLVQFEAVVGKFDRDYNVDDKLHEQYISIESVYKHDDYGGITNFYTADIAIAKLMVDIIFNYDIAPICLPYGLKYGEEVVTQGSVGHLAGWGLDVDKNQPSPALKVIKLPVVTTDECKRASAPEFLPFITGDKFCAGYLNGTSVCRTDTGGGLVFPPMVNGKTTYYLRGILSTRTNKENNCDTDKYTTFLNVADYLDFIQQYDVHFISRSRSTITQEPDIIDTNASCIPSNGDVLFAHDLKTKLKYGASTPNFGQIMYKCITNHVLVGELTNLCLNGTWTAKPPECIAYCDPKYINSVTISSTCYYKDNGQPVRCSDPARPGTVAIISCAHGYERPGILQQIVTCGEDGRWNPVPHRCSQICGQEVPDGIPFIVGGVVTNNTKVPWHVGIYKKEDENGVFEQWCGGTIVNARVVLSAMHCFWDRSEDKPYPVSQYSVAAGKFKRDYSAVEELKAQFFAVEQIHYPEGYYGLIYQLVPSDWIGRVAGWGLEKSSGLPSPVLKVIELPVITREQCKKTSSRAFIPYITNDKFCAGHLSGVSVCQGDSGGGLVFPTIADGKMKYYLRGIVSIGANNANSCDNNKYTTFVNVAFYMDFIGHYDIQYQPV